MTAVTQPVDGQPWTDPNHWSYGMTEDEYWEARLEDGCFCLHFGAGGPPGGFTEADVPTQADIAAWLADSLGASL